MNDLEAILNWLREQKLIPSTDPHKGQRRITFYTKFNPLTLENMSKEMIDRVIRMITIEGEQDTSKILSEFLEGNREVTINTIKMNIAITYPNPNTYKIASKNYDSCADQRRIGR